MGRGSTTELEAGEPLFAMLKITHLQYKHWRQSLNAGVNHQHPPYQGHDCGQQG